MYEGGSVSWLCAAAICGLSGGDILHFWLMIGFELYKLDATGKMH